MPIDTQKDGSRKKTATTRSAKARRPVARRSASAEATAETKPARTTRRPAARKAVASKPSLGKAAVRKPAAKQVAARKPVAPTTRISRVDAALEQPQVPTYEEIAWRAYQIYQTRGETAGDATADWLRAEAELNSGLA
jgi:hypothetical protein